MLSTLFFLSASPLARLTAGEDSQYLLWGGESDFAASPLTASGTFLAVSAKIPAGDCCNAAHHTPAGAEPQPGQPVPLSSGAAAALGVPPPLRKEP